MKTLKYILLFLIVSTAAFAADEVRAPYLTGETLFFVRYAANGDVFLSDGSASETWGTAGRGADDYDVAMTERKTGSGASGNYVGSFDTVPNIGAGVYDFDIFLQAGGSPADSDGPALFWGEMPWTGTAEDPAATQGDIVDAHTATDGKIDTTDALITSSHSTTDGKIDTTDALITSSHSATDALITAIDTVVDAIKAVTDLLPDSGALTSLATLANQTWMKNFLEADTFTDTTTTPWREIVRLKGTTTPITVKELFETDGDDIVAENQRIGRITEPAP
jgi:hypothetical protein